MKIKFFYLLLAVLITVSFVGCSTIKKQEQHLYASDVKEAPVSAEPQRAVAAIYLGKEYKAEDITEADLAKVVKLDTADVIEMFGKFSNPKNVLADIIIVKPLPGARNLVRDQLSAYKEVRIKEFENYNILDAHGIAKNAIVYDQGEYLVLLMLEDNEAAQVIIDEYIPQ